MSVMRRWFGGCEWTLPQDFLEFTHFRRVVDTLDWNSSPGYPYMRTAPDNRRFFCVDADGIPDPGRLLEVWSIVQERLRNGEPDHIRLFVKLEPHKLKKLDEGRYRLISSVSVIDQLVDHMLFDELNNKMVDNYAEIPAKVGWSFTKGGWMQMPKEKWVALDKSAWDWTVRPWMLEMCLHFRDMMYVGSRGADYELWRELAERRYKELYDSPTFITSGGAVLRQLSKGVQKSGCVNTIADNSLMQVLLHLRCCFETNQKPEWLLVMGDDTLQRPQQDMSRYLECMGQYCLVKAPVLANEFAGLRFLGERVEPLYKGKHAFTILHLIEDAELRTHFANSYLLLYHRSLHSLVIRTLFEEMGIEGLVTEDELDFIYDCE